jgi:transcription initiation factor IIE alpha subunit|tara:strand:+ start:5981 stop:6217 length:237 start_codon:yes stop_codon:yes gene_type:complete
MNHLKTAISEIVQELGNTTDDDLKSRLKKKKIEINDQELNNVLLHLEIQGLISVTRIGKDKRRIEIGTRTAKQPQTIW